MKKSTGERARKRTYGTGAVYLRGHYWWIKYHVPWESKPRRESARTTSKRKAENLLRKRLDEVDNASLGQKDARAVTFQDLTKLLVKNYNFKRNRSTRTMLASVAHLQKRFGRMLAMNIESQWVSYVLERREEGASDATLYKERAALQRMFRLARKPYKLPMPDLEPIVVNNARLLYFTEPQFLVIFGDLPDHLKGPCCMAYVLGWRKQEILGLEWQQVSFEAGTVTLPPTSTKSKKPRVIEFRGDDGRGHGEIERLLMAQWEKKKRLERKYGRVITTVFFKPDGSPIRDITKKGRWGRALRRAGLEHMVFHDFCRSSIRTLDRVVGKSVGKQITGRATDKMWDRYNVILPGDTGEGLARLAKHHDRVLGTAWAQSRKDDRKPAAGRTPQPFGTYKKDAPTGANGVWWPSGTSNPAVGR